eukprot:CAMPEP_0113717538 /NCGR_PEP_ID=MMETSP0038_2-20120614/34603_1 /TAXON_ID=2898 /ORGANISM="Cryptomonas paramecium" /LENGTH=58 /DNA_ID=CAMNT_0000645387 /DNA_START=18 /DNA_END=194 /DNA_ORIENTATION=- /assembly_acc=CAM_ASM_000170
MPIFIQLRRAAAELGNAGHRAFVDVHHQLRRCASSASRAGRGARSMRVPAPQGSAGAG